MNGLAALIARPDGDGTPAGLEQWQLMREQAGVFIQSGMLPSHIRSPEQAIVIMLKGRELGLPPLYALSSIGIINGKPVVAAEVMASLVYRRHGDQALRIVQSDARICTIEYRRRGWAEPQTYSFSIEDAHRAGLLTGNAWQRYPAAMLRARCISAVARMAFPDAISGVYTPEELGGSVQVIDDTPLPRVDAAEPGEANRHAGPSGAGPGEAGRERPVSYTDRDLPAARPLREAGDRPSAAPSAEAIRRIEHMRRVRAVWYGEDEALPAPRTQEEADRAISLLQGLLRLRVPNADRPASPDQLLMLREAVDELAAAGADPGQVPDNLTCAQGYRLYKELIRRRATHLSMVRPPAGP